MERTKPPFRADHVGSFLRPAALKDARAKREKGEITAAQLKEVEDREIEKIIKKQEEIGLQLATDGEYPPLVLALRFLRHARRRRDLRARSRHPVSGRADQAEVDPRHRQDRVLQSPDARALQVSQGAHQGDAEDDHPVADGDAFPPRARRGRQGRLSRSRRDLRRPRRRLPEGGAGVLRRRLPLSAVRRHRLGLSVLAGGAEEGAGTAASTSITCRTPTRAPSTRRSKASPPT